VVRVGSAITQQVGAKMGSSTLYLTGFWQRANSSSFGLWFLQRVDERELKNTWFSVFG